MEMEKKLQKDYFCLVLTSLINDIKMSFLPLTGSQLTKEGWKVTCAQDPASQAPAISFSRPKWLDLKVSMGQGSMHALMFFLS